MKTIIACILILILNFFQTSPINYKEVKMNNGLIHLSIPSKLKEMTFLDLFYSNDRYSKTYISTDTTIFLFVRVQDNTENKFCEAVDHWKHILRQQNTSTVFLSNKTYFRNGFWVSSIAYKTEMSGSHINRLSVYTTARYVLSIEVWVKNTYKGQCGNSEEMIDRINNSVKLN